MDPKTVFEPHIESNNIQLGSQKVKNNPKIKSKLNIRIEENKENKKLLHYISRLQNNLNLTPILKIAYFLPQKAKIKFTLKLDEN